jgi:two-component system sensor histidine kinase RegB
LKEQVSRCKQALSVMSASAGEIRAESGHLMPLTTYLDDVVRSWKQQLRGVKLDYRKAGPEPIPEFLAEQTLTHALVNILNNAAEVSTDGLSLHVRWDYRVVILRILDTGPGIPPDISRQLGKEPISTKDNGLGVGLFLAFSTIHRLGGVIEMTARERQLGTCTRIELPVVAQKRI